MNSFSSILVSLLDEKLNLLDRHCEVKDVDEDHHVLNILAVIFLEMWKRITL